jgi:hypothetical protein
MGLCIKERNSSPYGRDEGSATATFVVTSNTLCTFFGVCSHTHVRTHTHTFCDTHTYMHRPPIILLFMFIGVNIYFMSMYPSFVHIFCFLWCMFSHIIYARTHTHTVMHRPPIILLFMFVGVYFMSMYLSFVHISCFYFFVMCPSIILHIYIRTTTLHLFKGIQHEKKKDHVVQMTQRLICV